MMFIYRIRYFVDVGRMGSVGFVAGVQILGKIGREKG